MKTGEAILVVGGLGIGAYLLYQAFGHATTLPIPQPSAMPSMTTGGGNYSPNSGRAIENSVSVYGVNAGAIAGKIGDAAGAAPTAVKVLFPVVALWGITQGAINNPSKEASNVVHTIGDVASSAGHAIASIF